MLTFFWIYFAWAASGEKMKERIFKILFLLSDHLFKWSIKHWQENYNVTNAISQQCHWIMTNYSINSQEYISKFQNSYHAQQDDSFYNPRKWWWVPHSGFEDFIWLLLWYIFLWPQYELLGLYWNPQSTVI